MDEELRPTPSSIGPAIGAFEAGGSELRELLIGKARELFQLCDIESKGFITTRCMQKLKGQIPLESEQLEEVFKRLDVDGNGYLTLEEFTNGFGMFMGIDTRPRKMSCTQKEMLEAFGDSRSRIRRVSSVEELDEEEPDDSNFEHFLDSLGAHQLFKDEDYVRLMWDHLRKENPSMLQNFEEFLTKVTGNIKRTEKECSSLESALINRKMQQEEQVQKLYEEMETQLEQEKERTLNEERKRQERLRTELAAELQNKDRILQELLDNHAELEKRFNGINCSETDIKLRNAKLEKERDTLEKRLTKTESVVEKMQNYMEILRQQTLNEKKALAQSALQASDLMTAERDNLIKHLEMLRTVNKQLLDQKDEISILLREKKEITSQLDAEERRSDYFSIDEEEASMASQVSRSSVVSEASSRSRRGSRLSDYLLPGTRNLSGNTLAGVKDDCGAKYILLDRDASAERRSRSSGPGSLEDSPAVSSHVIEHPLQSSEEGGIDETWGHQQALWAVHETASAPSVHQRTPSCDANNPFSLQQPSPRGTEEHGVKTSRSLVHPERLFKVVIVGDSAVGKSSLINRFAQGQFIPSFNATIGVDFRVKSVALEGRSVALQLWDTAGQERFRSITKQYFRKADGVIVVYDVTSEETFKNVRAWVSTLKEEVTDEIALMIVGNKADTDTALRMVQFTTGRKLAHEYEAIFHETSAKTGHGIDPAMKHLASLLRVKEDEDIAKAVNFQGRTPAKKCC